jgi:hypothetical protein
MDRYALINQLLNDEERINAEFVTGQIERDLWVKSLMSVDERLSVLGVRLSFRPWEGLATAAANKF